MVSIVIVSHSLLLARGIEELAHQMSAGRVPIAVAAGIDDPDNPIGTDAVAIMTAIESVYSAGGVVVLMDMGSAILSAEMALELLDEDMRAGVRLIAAPVVEGTMSAVASAAAGLDIGAVVDEAMGALSAKLGHLSPPEPRAAEAPAPGTDVHRAEFAWTVRNPNGIHARPAARIVAAAGASAGNVAVRKAGVSANAKSLNALAGLNIRQGDEIQFLAEGDDAGETIAALRRVAEDHFGEAGLVAQGVTQTDEAEEAVTPAQAGAVTGIAVSEGIAMANARWFVSARPVIKPREASAPAEEERLLAQTIATVTARLEQQGRGAQGEIFLAHKAMLDDPELRLNASARINSGETAESAWMAVMQATAAQYRDAESRYLQEREADVHDLTDQVLRELCGSDGESFTTDAPCILLAKDLMPSQVAGLNKEHILGICLSGGGKTSHSAILARAMGIPALVRATGCAGYVKDGQPVILDGFTGRLWYAPDRDTADALAQRGAEWRQARAEAEKNAHQPALTRAGRRIAVLANIGGVADIDEALRCGAEGVGLFRTEFLFQDSPELPGEDAQYEAYCRVAAAFGEQPVTIRTLDVGGDKPLPAYPMPAEENPFLGLRGIRLCLARPTLFEPQIRALLRAAREYGNIQVMFPMVSTQEEVAQARAIVRRQAEALGIPAAQWPKLGIMIEVPAAVLIADTLAQEVDFFSIGTNDLTQYIMAADRGNDAVAELVDYTHPAVLSAIETVCRAGSRHGIPVSMCGEMAGDRRQTGLLLSLGLEKLSASATLLPGLKEEIKTL